VRTSHKISVLVPTTDELMADAPQLFGGLLQQAMTDARPDQRLTLSGAAPH